jgi:hypothetical protein
MVEQILPNNNERCYSNFLLTFHQLNSPHAQLLLFPQHCSEHYYLRPPLNVVLVVEEIVYVHSRLDVTRPEYVHIQGSTAAPVKSQNVSQCGTEGVDAWQG